MRYEAKIIQGLRAEVGLSQADLAKKLGYASPQFISNIERGLCGVPIDKIKIIDKAYGKTYAKRIAMAKMFDFKKQLKEWM